jgi:hypothetical protein
VTADWKINTIVLGEPPARTGGALRRQPGENDINAWRVSGIVVKSVSDHMSMGMDLDGLELREQQPERRG